MFYWHTGTRQLGGCRVWKLQIFSTGGGANKESVGVLL